MQGSHSYAIIASKDMEVAGDMLRLGHYNYFVRLCQQYVEKILKEVVCRLGDGEEYVSALNTHNLFRISQKVTKLTEISFSKDEQLLFRSLTEYYFDTNYPGENYFEVSEEEALGVCADMKMFVKKFGEALEDKNIGGVVFPETLKLLNELKDL